MDLNQLNELDFNNIGSWPPAFKAGLILILCVAVGYGWYHFSTQDQIQQLEQVQNRESQLRREFEQKQERAANLDNYKRQIEEMEESFGALLKRLPDRSEIDSLLIEVSQAGLAVGLEFELFQPRNEVTRDFYTELPINVRVTGQYHQFGEFVSGLAALPRIVTVHDIKIDPRSGEPGQPGVRLVMNAIVKTYRYLEGGAR